jgi:hypothetical protein
VLAAALFAGEHLLRPLAAGLPVLREESLLLVLLLFGAGLYAALVIALLGRNWLKQLARDRGGGSVQPEPPLHD